ncbi:MAG: hypothetical protein DRI34_08515 [Deltaproteobacteria bacterium]|nr:MAG: hypothetical protein DRI34_08515 [Deltaproteobacteria bacterium]
MELGEAIERAISYETRVRDLYREAAQSIADPVGRRVLQLLAEEEQGHLDFLEHLRGQWRKNGRIDDLGPPPGSRLPPRPQLQRSLEKLASLDVHAEPAGHEKELEVLGRALQAERETSAFYRQLAGELDADGRRLFDPFVEIEDGHLTLVQAQIDSLRGLGYWYDFKEFDLESG